VASTSDRHRPSGGLGQLFILAYDHLGSIVLLNILWGIGAIPWLIVAAAMSQLGVIAGAQLQIPAVGAVGLAAGFTFCLYSPPTFMLLVATAPWLRGQDTPDRARLWQLVRGRFLAVQGIGLLCSATTILFLVNVLFYHSWQGWLGATLSGFMVWLLAALALVSLYWLPLLAADPQVPVRQALRRGLFLVFSHPLPSLVLLFTLILLAALGMVSGIGWLCGLWTVGALQLNLGVARLLHLHGGEPVAQTTPTWRQLLRPWE
jgi:uncharacterized membrane protein YesL